ncbi:ABC transporter ATP-binding protein [Pseudobacteriovorax antillogorgiicola]|uniref:ATP-binding cassette, subfamily B n=1 Tax=Pseudobacteriovorax antillogorgiicola TaxID=1513793 RepID=A0A1Y6CI51_9BACT|nr:ABC transporter ATP-binding protein [Pseudobacteriovorax antillogorgiicola]TCS48590.1 ATP-binding cassette subfamily B protein [Pseudobacteriovorax antillogorgiicola]SMF55647.1 ATP-binding cassette, subfamily B [Pseudobacteriovorax antillogorgiicola]
MSLSMYKSYGHNILGHWPLYLAGTLSLLLTTCTEVLIPKFIQWAVDHLTNSQGIPSLFLRETREATLDTMMYAFLIVLCVGWWGRVGWRQLLARRTHDAGHKLKTEFWDSLKHQPLSFTQRYSLGDLMNRATGDWNKSRFIHGFTMVLTFDVVFFTVLSLISMLMIDVTLTLAALVIVPFLPRAIIKLSRREYDQHQVAQETLSELSDSISQAVQTIRLQRSTATELIWKKSLAAKARSYAKEQFEVLRIGWKIFILGAAPTLVAYGVLFTFGVYQYQQGVISIGEFLALQSYVLLLQSPLFELGSVISEWQTGFASFARVHEILRLKKEPLRTQVKPSQKTEAAPTFSVEHMNFRYHEETPCLISISLKIQKGEKIGITGPIGSGKTTLINILAGLLDGYQGRVLVQGFNMEDLGSDWLSETITVVPQKPFLFAGSIRHNLSLGAQVTEERMIAALKMVRLWSDVEEMADGLDTWIGEWGINLSGGQKQRLAIARSLLKHSDVLILDDSLSAVDSVTEHHILSALSQEFEHKTIIWTAHRLSTLQLCDRIFKLEDGRLQQIKEASQ